MNDSMVRTLLGIAGVLVIALLLGMFPGPAGGVALASAAVFCVMACRMKYLQTPTYRQEPEPSDGSLLALARLWHRVVERLRPDANLLNSYSSETFSYGVCVLDREFHVVWCNASSADHFGVRAESAIGRPFNGAARLAAYVAAGDFTKPLQVEGACNEGTVLSVSLVPYLRSQWLLLSRDVTADACSEAARRNGVADALHELCTPVTVLAGYLDTIGRIKLDSRRSKEYLRAMEEQCRRMQRTIEDLLDLWTLESATMMPRHDRVPVGAMLSRIRQDAEALSRGQHRIHLNAEAGVELLGTEGELASAFGNLALNAIRYTPSGGEVRLLWRATADGAEFSVEDTGIGIAAEHIPRLTERFYRVNRDFSRDRGGTGLGLAIVKDVLDRHQATLVIESKPGIGSCFRARFPAHRVLLPATPAPAIAEAEARADEQGAVASASTSPAYGSRVVVPFRDTGTARAH
jgi:two-component system, OmpR family, phosphate regulon sensor histidine kinase PhoR